MEMRRRFMKEKLLTPPNICTMLRIVGTVGLLLIRPLTLPFYLLYTFCGITDVLDGTIARATNSTSEFGARLDSISDLIFYAVMIVKFFPILLEVLPVWMWYCIGDIVHNDLEVERLRLRGLKTIEHEQFARLQHCRVLFRAHGEPPVSYEIAQKNEVEVIDASCPVVLNLQKRIRKAYEQTREQGGQVVIYGKRGHAEVVGLVGQTNGEALVIENPEDIRQIDFSRPVILFSQTTKSLEGFQAIAALLKEKGGAQVVVNDTICRKVANRIPQLREFAQKHDVVIFVSGEKSSNGKQLFATCCEVNPRTYLVQRAEDVKPEMLENAQSVGISGATSTPAWVMEEIRHKIELQ